MYTYSSPTRFGSKQSNNNLINQFNVSRYEYVSDFFDA